MRNVAPLKFLVPMWVLWYPSGRSCGEAIIKCLLARGYVYITYLVVGKKYHGCTIYLKSR